MKPKYTIILFIILLVLILFPLFTFRESVKSKKAKKAKKAKEKKRKAAAATAATATVVGAGTVAVADDVDNTQQIDRCTTLLSNNGINVKNGSGVAGANGQSGVADSAAGTDANYSYLNFIKTPKELQMSGKGTLKTLEKDIKGLISYVELLVQGNSKASKTKGPLGNKFFVETKGKCKSIDKDTKDSIQSRYLYINNVPLGKIPLISDSKIKDFRGIIPGLLQNIDVISPENVANAFFSASIPDCMSVTLDTINSKGIVGSATHYVAVADIVNLDPCLFSKNANNKRINPSTKAGCKEGFQSINEDSEIEDTNSETSDAHDLIQENIQKDYISQLFLSSFGLFGIYILFLAMKKMK